MIKASLDSRILIKNLPCKVYQRCVGLIFEFLTESPGINTSPNPAELALRSELVQEPVD